MIELATNGKPVESVWDFPRPPRIERVEWRLRAIHQGHVLVDAPWAYRVLETSQPPAYYAAPEFVDRDRLEPSEQRSMCEWKGLARYAHLRLPGGDEPVVHDVGWSYPEPTTAFHRIRDHWAFYAQKLDECYVDDERVLANEGSFYGGWITVNVTGPFKGGPGTMHW